MIKVPRDKINSLIILGILTSTGAAALGIYVLITFYEGWWYDPNPWILFLELTSLYSITLIGLLNLLLNLTMFSCNLSKKEKPFLHPPHPGLSRYPYMTFGEAEAHLNKMAIRQVVRKE